ncbi:hypothetical protein [Paracoccus caeni]|nr:hypothetical protein [Paracoccus caeni]
MADFELVVTFWTLANFAALPLPNGLVTKRPVAKGRMSVVFFFTK